MTLSASPHSFWRAAGRIAATLAIATGCVVIGAGSANAADCGGDFAPDHGTLDVRGENGNIHIDLRFTYSQAHLDNLNCFKPAALEPDVLVSGAVQNYGKRKSSSNLPGSYNDTEFDDDYSIRTLTVGTTKTKKLEAGKEYYVSLDLNNYVLLIDKQRTVGVDFQRGHWASKKNPREAAACLRGGWRDPAWCVNASDHKAGSQLGMPPLQLPPGSGAYSLHGSW